MWSHQSTKTNKVACDVTIEACVVMSFVCVEWHCVALSPTGRRLAVVYLVLSGGVNQMTTFEIIIAVLSGLSDCMLAYYVLSCKCCCELGLCLASSAHVTRAQHRTISGHRDNRKVADSAIDRLIDMSHKKFPRTFVLGSGSSRERMGQGVNWPVSYWPIRYKERFDPGAKRLGTFSTPTSNWSLYQAQHTPLRRNFPVVGILGPWTPLLNLRSFVVLH